MWGRNKVKQLSKNGVGQNQFMPFLGQANATQNPLEQLDNIRRKLTVQNKENILTHTPYMVYLQSEMYTFRMVSSMSVQWYDSK